ncbi:MAG TPA: DUF4292 domain-containing protein [Terriglobales bacterium]|nr:DUF4292 domain-containing protein [Terriglobales bacterium]
MLLAALTPTTACLFRSHRVPKRVLAQNIQSATPEQLIARIDEDAEKIQSLNSTVDIVASVGGSSKGKVTEYQEIRGYILARKPAWLHMIGLFPIVRNRAFDMVSDGQRFKLWIPAKNKFIVGSNEVNKPSKQPLENLRPQHIYNSLLLQPVDPQDEIAVVENSSETVLNPKKNIATEYPDYVVDIIHRGPKGWYLSRKIYFSRVDLQPHRQLVYDLNGYVATDVKYEDFREVQGVSFPFHVTIWRPQEEYSVTISMVTIKLNEPLKDEQFALAQPAGAQVVSLDSATASGNGTTK